MHPAADPAVVTRASRPERPLRFQAPDGLVLTGLLWEAPGEPRAPEVLFAPGNGLPVQAYRAALAGLPADGALHALNPAGHGGSAVPAALENWDAMLAELRAYVEQCLHPPVILAGHSMGAMLALRLAAEAPALVAGLLLLEPTLRVRRGEAPSPALAAELRAFVERARGRRERWAQRADAAAWLAGAEVYRLWDAQARADFLQAGLLAEADGAVRLATPPWLEAAIYQTVPDQQMFGWADRARCAAVLLYGLETQAAAPAALEELAQALPVAAVVPVAGTHTFPLEHPRETGVRMAAALRLLRGETGLALTESAAARRR